jgi:hypothetical protein
MPKIFDAYEQEFIQCTNTAAQNIEKIPDLLPGHERDSLCSATSKSIEAAEDIVKQMELEARSLEAGDEKQEAVAQTKDYKTSIGKLKESFKAAKLSNRAEEKARAELFQQTDQAQLGEAENQRARLIASTKRLQKGTDKLKAACQIAGVPLATTAHAPRPGCVCAPAFRADANVLTRRGSRDGAGGRGHPHQPRGAEDHHRASARKANPITTAPPRPTSPPCPLSPPGAAPRTLRARARQVSRRQHAPRSLATPAGGHVATSQSQQGAPR